MTTLALSAGGRTWRVGFEDWAMPAADLFQALVNARAIDEATGRAVAGALRVSCDRSTLSPITVGDGAFGFGGRPRGVWGGAAAIALGCNVVVEAEGFLPRFLNLALPAQPGYPDLVAPLAVGDVDLHRLPVRLRGRVIAADGAPRAGATVSVAALWRRMADHIDETSPPTIGALAGIAPGAARFRSGAGLRARVRRLVPRPERGTLLDDVLPGARRLRVSAGIPFVPASATDVIAIPGLGDTVEIVHVDAIASPVTPDAVLVDLRHPLAEAHSRGTEIRNAALGAAGAWSLVQHGIHAGDRSICLGNGAVLAAIGELLEIEGGGAPTELATLSRLSATADGNGRFELPHVHRAALIRLRAQHPAEPNPAESTFVLEPALAETRADLTFPA
jgi:hypothetical protein